MTDKQHNHTNCESCDAEYGASIAFLQEELSEAERELAEAEAQLVAWYEASTYETSPDGARARRCLCGFRETQAAWSALGGIPEWFHFDFEYHAPGCPTARALEKYDV